MSERACAVRHSHILSRFLRVCVTGTLAQCRQFFAPRRPPRKRAVLATGQQIILPFSCHSCSARSTNWQSGNLTKCALIQTTLRFVCRAVCDAQKTEKRREFSGQDVGMSDRARALRHSPPGQGCAPTPSTPCQMHVKKSLRASGKPSKSVAVITNVSEAR